MYFMIRENPTIPERGDPAIPERLSDVDTAEMRATLIDDFLNVYVNETVVIKGSFGDYIPWLSFRQFLKHGNNEIRAFLKNGQYGGCGANFEVRINGTIIKSLGRTWSLERSAANAVCADETMELNFK
jgi:hypothetical protein